MPTFLRVPNKNEPTASKNLLASQHPFSQASKNSHSLPVQSAGKRGGKAKHSKCIKIEILFL